MSKSLQLILKSHKSGFLLLVFFSLFACVDIEEYPNNPRGNFEALWTIMDEHYCFFEYKKEWIDWNKIHSEYKEKVKNDMDDEALFALLNEMLQELKDGHVNLYTPFDVGRYWKWFEDYESNFDESLINKYLDSTYAIAGSIRYQILEDNIGYLYYGNFSSVIGETNLDYIIHGMSDCRGLIIDVRNNGGGLLSNVNKIASRFVTEKTLVGYMQHKTGKAHDAFSEPVARYIEPSARLHYQKPVVVLTNRSCFSATNDFVNAMRYCPKVTILGDRTGGGSGLPFSSELPNGWSVRFSVCPMLDADKNHLELGIEPCIRKDLLPSDVEKGKDTLIEAAKQEIKNWSSSCSDRFN
ncbi:MAG: S41 family peptidase [Dysgonamonadaceae bacterium]|nr:S41 family peptidase [Dysgonamonadaceae bacterium]